MQHVPFALSIMLLAGGCAVVDMPTENDSYPVWVGERLDNGGDGRRAPVMIPVTSVPPGELATMDNAARLLLAEKAAMEAEAQRLESRNARGSAEDFVTDGQVRTDPPQQ